MSSSLDIRLDVVDRHVGVCQDVNELVLGTASIGVCQDVGECHLGVRLDIGERYIGVCQDVSELLPRHLS